MIEIVGAGIGKARDGPRERGLAQDVAGIVRGAILLDEHFAEAGVVPELFEARRVARRGAGQQAVPVARNRRWPAQQLGPRQGAVLGVKSRQPGNNPGNRDGPVALADSLCGSDVAGRHLGHAVVAVIAPLGGAYEDLDAPAQVAHGRLRHGQRETGRDRGVGRIAAALENIARDVGGDRVRGRRHGVRSVLPLFWRQRLATGQQQGRDGQGKHEPVHVVLAFSAWRRAALPARRPGTPRVYYSARRFP